MSHSPLANLILPLTDLRARKHDQEREHDSVKQDEADLDWKTGECVHQTFLSYEASHHLLFGQSTYGQHVLRRTTVDPPALSHYKQLLNRPSSDRPLAHSPDGDDTRNQKQMYNTVSNAGGHLASDMHNDSIISTKDEMPYATAQKFPHEQMLLSQGRSLKDNVFKQRA